MKSATLRKKESMKTGSNVHFIPLLRRISRIAERDGLKVYVVGGYVRDQLVKRETKDIDFAVLGNGIAFARSVADELGGSQVVTFEKFGTARTIVDGHEMEFVGTRKEEYESKSRKPSVVRGTIEDDLQRRDFTVNALAAELGDSASGPIIDPYGGLKHLNDKFLTTPIDPVKTFSDDPLRMMRAFRFMAQLGFELDPVCYQAIKDLHERIVIVSMERIRDEFLKILLSPKPSIGLAPLLESGLLQHFFPQLQNLAGVDQRSIDYPDGVRSYHHKDVFYHTLQVLDNLSESTENLWLRFAALLHDIAKPKTKAFREDVGWTFHGHAELGARMVKKIFHTLKLPLENVHYVEKLVALHLRPIALAQDGVTDSAIRRLLFDAGDAIDDLLALCQSDITSKNPRLVKRYLRNYELLKQRLIEVEEHDRLRNWKPPLSGVEIMKLCAIQEGVAVGILKSRIEDAILDGIIPNEHDAAVGYLLQIKDQVLKHSAGKKSIPRKAQMSRLPENLRS